MGSPRGTLRVRFRRHGRGSDLHRSGRRGPGGGTGQSLRGREDRRHQLVSRRPQDRLRRSSGRVLYPRPRDRRRQKGLLQRLSGLRAFRRGRLVSRQPLAGICARQPQLARLGLSLFPRSGSGVPCDRRVRERLQPAIRSRWPVSVLDIGRPCQRGRFLLGRRASSGRSFDDRGGHPRAGGDVALCPGHGERRTHRRNGRGIAAADRCRRAGRPGRGLAHSGFLVWIPAGRRGRIDLQLVPGRRGGVLQAVRSGLEGRDDPQPRRLLPGPGRPFGDGRLPGG